MSQSEPVVLYTEEHNVGVITLNRPSKLNSLTMASFHEISALLCKLSHRRDLRVVVIHGANGTFSSGLAVTDVLTNPDNAPALLSAYGPHPHNLAQHICCAWRLLPFPVIAAIEGHCFGGGLQLAMGADLRLSSPNAQLSILEARWGLVPDMGLAVTGDCIRADWKARLMMGGEIVDAARACEAGLTTEIVINGADPRGAKTRTFSSSFLQLRDARLRERTLQLCEQYLQCDPVAVAAAKKLQWDAHDQWTWAGASDSADPGQAKSHGDQRWGAWLCGEYDRVRFKQEERLQLGLLKNAARKMMTKKKAKL